MIEVLPKEKKQKEDKFQTFGQAVFDLFQILRGDTNVSFKLPVYSTPGSTLESQPADVPLVINLISTTFIFEFQIYFSKNSLS